MAFLESLAATKLAAQYTYMAALIFAGSTTNALMRYQEARKNGVPFDLIDFIIALVLAGFSGWMVGLLAEVLGYAGKAQLVAAGFGAFLGISGLNRIAETVIGVLEARYKK